VADSLGFFPRPGMDAIPVHSGVRFDIRCEFWQAAAISVLTDCARRDAYMGTAGEANQACWCGVVGPNLTEFLSVKKRTQFTDAALDLSN
jgi:hypothetical protein